MSKSSSPMKFKNVFWQFFVAACASVGSFALGYDDGWGSPAGPSIRDDLSVNATATDLDWIVSGIPIGSTIGAVLAFVSTNYVGRRGTMLLISPFYILAHLLTVLTTNPTQIFIGRILTGMVDISTTMASQIYTSEIATPELRGAVSSLPSVALALGILVCYVIGAFVDWRVLTLCQLAFPIAYLSMWFHPESPVWLLKKGRVDDAQKALKRLRGQDTDISEELFRIKENCDREAAKPKFHIREILVPLFFHPVLLLVPLVFLQMFSGYGAVVYNSVTILEGNSPIDVGIATIILAVCLVVAVLIVSIFIDSLGRKALMLTSGLIIKISLLALGTYFYLRDTYGPEAVEHISWLPFASLVVFYTSYAGGYSSVPYIMLAELSPVRYRDIMGSIGYFSSNLLIFVVVRTFPELQKSIGDYGAFWLYACILAVGAVFVIVFVPETKGKTLEDIEYFFKKSPDQELELDSVDKKGIDNPVCLNVFSTDN
ncbi:facilitated trehalose transporter Tret1-like [Artemia franciscana]|uniref:Major facilitator superfamily (MFS) profile domain-containing protein n=1 Tax=Artemia franciscana TaxID=6661 RepID=A0AA88L1F2_ARTSF|nr:hypothetical protein QYM36_017609 [Artemia franciscana]